MPSKRLNLHIHVGIVGAGIGGLAAAIALRRAGAQVTVLESSKELGEVCLPHSPLAIQTNS